MTFIFATVLSGCLIDEEAYRARLAALQDADEDGWSVEQGDCDDADGARHPDASDGCDGVDNDCDGASDEDAVVTTWFADDDGDGFGDPDSATPACAAPDGFVVDDTDCDDADATRFPDGTEAWDDDGIDNDCDGDSLDPLSWDASSATTRLDAPTAGVELGRRLAYWEAGACLFPTAPYADESRGVVYAERAASGEWAAGSGGTIVGPEPYAYLTALDVDDGGALVVGSVTADEAAGTVWLLDASTVCDGGPVELGGAAAVDGSPGDLLGAQARWLPDLDGDGLRDLAIAAPGYGGGEGAVAFLYDAGPSMASRSIADADVLMTGGHATAALQDVVYAQSRDEAWLLFARTNADSGAVSLRRVPVSALADASVDDLADGGVAGEASLSATVAGDMTNDGADELVIGAAGWALWDVTALAGVVEEGDAVTPITAGEEGEWLTTFTAIGDVDGGGRADLLVQADDWPAGTARGRLAILPGEELLPGQANTFEGQRRQALGAELGDAFGYRAMPVRGFVGSDRNAIAVAAYGADHGGTSSGSVYFLPLP